jgi:hypothetical protein
MADSSLKAPLSSNQEQIRRELLPREWSAALVLDYLSKSEYGGELTSRVLSIGSATYNLQVTLEGVVIDLDLAEQALLDHINSNSAHGVTGFNVGSEDYCSATTGGVVLLAGAVTDAPDSTVNILTADVGAAGATYSQAYAQQQTDLINELKAAVNQLATDLNACIEAGNDALGSERTAKQRAL